MIDEKNRAFFLRSPASPLPIEWRWPNFRYEELECRDGAGLLIVPGAMDRLQNLRTIIGAPIYVHSAYRSIAYNEQVGGASQSYHLSGCAFDISNRSFDHNRLVAAAEVAGFTGIGVYGTFIHVDIGPRRVWRG